MNKVMKVGIVPREQFQKRILDAAAGRSSFNANDPILKKTTHSHLNAPKTPLAAIRSQVNA